MSVTQSDLVGRFAPCASFTRGGRSGLGGGEKCLPGRKRTSKKREEAVRGGKRKGYKAGWVQTRQRRTIGGDPDSWRSGRMEQGAAGGFHPRGLLKGEGGKKGEP